MPDETTRRTLATVLGFIKAGGRYLGKKKMDLLRSAIHRVLNHWKDPDTFECITCPRCSGSGWFGRRNERLDGSLAYEEVCCALCAGQGQLYRLSYTAAGHRDESKGARRFISKGVSRHLIKWG